MSVAEKTSRHNILLVKGDLSKLQKKFGRQASPLLRNLIHNFVQQITEEENPEMSTISELYSRPLEELDDADLDALIADLRNRQNYFLTNNKPAPSPKKTSKKMTPEMEAIAASLKLDL